MHSFEFVTRGEFVSCEVPQLRGLTSVSSAVFCVSVCVCLSSRSSKEQVVRYKFDHGFLPPRNVGQDLRRPPLDPNSTAEDTMKAILAGRFSEAIFGNNSAVHAALELPMIC